MPNSSSEHSCNDEILIWDMPAPPDENSKFTVLWNSFSTCRDGNEVSIPKELEEKAQHYRSVYLAWLFDLGELEFKGQKIAKRLELPNGLSYWWLTRICEKCNFAKSPQLENAIKLIVFNELFCNQPLTSINLVSTNKALCVCLKRWCKSRGIGFDSSIGKTSVPQENRFHKFILKSLPKPICAIFWFIRHIQQRLHLIGVGVKEWECTSNTLTIVSFSAGMDKKLLKRGVFKSHYWSQLPSVLHENNVPTNWIHIYVKDSLLSDSKAAALAVQSYNKSSKGDVHTTIDSFLGIRVVLGTLRNWLMLIMVSFGIRKTLSKHTCNNMHLWPLLRDDWKQSITGIDALKNLLFMNLFDKAISKLPQQKSGVFLQENQCWERALIHSWHRFKHKNIYGYPHSTTRDWDLRYFFDPRCYTNFGECRLPLPTKIAVHGELVRTALVDGGYPLNMLVEVEALRYLHLSAATKNNDCPRSASENFRVLVIGGYIKENTHRQMQLLNDAVGYFNFRMDIVVKPHPLCNIETHLYPNISAKLTSEPIEDLLIDCDVAYTDCVTSAAVDAYCFGVPVVSERDPKLLNISPLRGRSDVFFVCDSSELAAVFHSIVRKPNNHKNDRLNFFHTDSTLPRWRKLIAVKYDS